MIHIDLRGTAGWADELAAAVADDADRTGDRILIGIAGAPGAGKSTVAAALAQALDARGIRSVVLPMDGFHLPQARLVELGRRERMGAPDTFDVEGFVDILTALRDPDGTDGTVRAPLFDRDIEEPVPLALEIASEVRVVIVEGNYLLHDSDGWDRVAPLLDQRWYLDVDEGLRLERLIARHIAHGKTADDAAAWVTAVDEPNAVLIARGRGRADRAVAVD